MGASARLSLSSAGRLELQHRLTPVIDTTNTNKALTRSRLSHVDQNYLRADTTTAANAALITAQSRIELAQMWGGGLLASVDGLRFVVPVKGINTGPLRRHYGYKRGVDLAEHGKRPGCGDRCDGRARHPPLSAWSSMSWCSGTRATWTRLSPSSAPRATT
ncbi:Tn3 family transposase [Streptomyces sp. CL12-4]|nr:Tn3 family transposase [Streptomyces sp. CL12-4]